MTEMSRGERSDLAVIVRKREKVMKALAKERSAGLLAEFETQIDRFYSWDDHPAWQRAARKVAAVLDEAKAEVESACIEMKIPKPFRPSIDWSWRGQGENAIRQRRNELRIVAKSRIAAIEKAALTRIEQLSLEAQTAIIAHGLQSKAAKAFLDDMPAIETLMPPLKITDMEKLLEREQASPSRLSWRDRLALGVDYDDSSGG
jgi:hypothetical protein